MSTRQRLSASIDASLLAQAAAAVSRGDAPNLSAWVNEAVRLKLEHDRRMTALRDFITAYEEEQGVISQREMDLAGRWARGGAKRVRGTRRRTA